MKEKVIIENKSKFVIPEEIYEAEMKKDSELIELGEVTPHPLDMFSPPD